MEQEISQEDKRSIRRSIRMTNRNLWWYLRTVRACNIYLKWIRTYFRP